MRVDWHPAKLSPLDWQPPEYTTVAVKASSCVACGTHLRAEQRFREPAVGERGVALAALLERVRLWQQEALRCRRCPERLVAR